MSGISARKRIWGWFFFDWASQPYHTLLVTFIFGPFFAGVAAEYFIAQGRRRIWPQPVHRRCGPGVWRWPGW